MSHWLFFTQARSLNVMEQITLNLSLEETNQVLEALGQLPYINVYQLINKIQSQAQTQLETQEAREQALSLNSTDQPT